MPKKVFAGLLAAFFLFAGVPVEAHADDQSYLTALHEAGLVNKGGNGVELALGYQICADIGIGDSGQDVAERIYFNSPLTRDGAAMLVMIAVTNLCPSYINGGTSRSPGVRSGLTV